MNEKKSIKKRYWSFIAYPESISSTWIQDLKTSGIKAAISPLHDSDVDEDGVIKKAHYHVLLAYSGPTTFNSVRCLTDDLGATIPIPIENIHGAYDYLCHINDPDKAQYNIKDIQFINGFDIRNYIALTDVQLLELKKSIQDIIIKNDMTEYSDLLDYLFFNGMDLEYDFATKRTILFNTYIAGRRHKKKKSKN